MTKQTDIPKDLQKVLKNGDTKEVFMKNWHDHVMNRDEIESFTTVIGDKLYHVKPKEDEVFIPYTEYNGDHSMNWILSIQIDNSKELFRKSTKSVDMVYWKLFSSPTKSKKNGK